MKHETKLELLIGLGLSATMIAGLRAGNMMAAGSCGASLFLILHRLTVRVLGNRTPHAAPVRTEPKQVRRRRTAVKPVVAEPKNQREYVEGIIAQGRYGLLLRPEVYEKLAPNLRQQTRTAMTQDMAAIGAGDVRKVAHDCRLSQEDLPWKDERAESHFLDRYLVTNSEFQLFVDAGGYADEEFWPPQIFSGVGQFVDSSGHAGPRFWSEGRFPKGEDDHPVVGISWYEAAAYAAWQGKSLPTDSQWIKAAACPLLSDDGSVHQLRYPWGDVFDEDRANLWSSGTSHTVSVTEFEAGCTATGIHQLVGNVWEWTASDYQRWWDKRDTIKAHALKSIRGGAYDSYFESQASTQFASADRPISRKHNIGFRCSLDVDNICPLALEEIGSTTTEQLCSV